MWMADAVSHAGGFVKDASGMNERRTKGTLSGINVALCLRLVEECFREGKQD